MGGGILNAPPRSPGGSDWWKAAGAGPARPRGCPSGTVSPAGLTPGAGVSSRGLGPEMGTRWATPGRAAGLLVLLLRCFGLAEPSELSGNRAASTLLL